MAWRMLKPGCRCLHMKQSGLWCAQTVSHGRKMLHSSFFSGSKFINMQFLGVSTQDVCCIFIFLLFPFFFFFSMKTFPNYFLEQGFLLQSKLFPEFMCISGSPSMHSWVFFHFTQMSAVNLLQQGSASLLLIF